MWHSRFVTLCLALLVLASVFCGAEITRCEPRGNEIRCVKRGHHSNRIQVRNTSTSKVTFRIGFRLTPCGWPGSEYANEKLETTAGSTISFDMPFTKLSKCREALIGDCKIDDSQSTDCNRVLATSIS